MFEPVTRENCNETPEKKDAYEFSIARMRKYKGKIEGTYLDLGGNHGWTAIHAINSGWERVVTFEPNLESLEVLRSNVSSCNLIEIRPTAIGKEGGKVFIETHRKPLNQKVRHAAKRGDEQEVICESFFRVVEEERPNFVKFDIEGSEYEIIDQWHPDEFVQGIALEVHSANKPDNFELIRDFLYRCRDQGFEMNHPGKYGMRQGLPKSWCSNFIMSRQENPDLSFYDQLSKEEW